MSRDASPSPDDVPSSPESPRDASDDAVEAFIERETKSQAFARVRRLLEVISSHRALDVDAGARSRCDAREVHLGARASWVEAAATSARSGRRGAAPRWPLLRTRDAGEDAGSSVASEERGACEGAFGYSADELGTLGAVLSVNSRSEAEEEMSACERQLLQPGRVWEGTISIPGSSGIEEPNGSPYAFQVMWYDPVAGAYLISHTAQGDEQLCHLKLHDDGSTGTMALSFADNETYCSGAIDGRTGVISGTVGQLVRAEEGFFEHADSTRNRFTLTPMDVEAMRASSREGVEGESERDRKTRGERMSRAVRRRKLVAQWAQSANVLAATYRIIQHIKDHFRSEHMWNYMLRKITVETKLMRVNADTFQSEDTAQPAVDTAIQSEALRDSEESGWETLQTEMDRLLHREADHVLWATFPSPALNSLQLSEGERDWCDIWTIERMNAEFVSCKFRMYARILRARVFKTGKEKDDYVAHLRTLRTTCHAEMNRVLSNMNLLLWRLFYGGDVPRNDRQTLIKNMVGILRVEEARMIIAYDNVDKALRECDVRLPMDAIERRLSIAVDESYTCSICLLEIERGEQALALECSHIFHPSCCSTWLHAHATCPNCRHSLS